MGMKYIKLFELSDEDQGSPRRGCWVTIKPNNIEFSKNYNDFLETHIGRIEIIKGDYIYVRFIFNDSADTDNIKNEFNHICVFKIGEIDVYSFNLKDLKLKIQEQKYNL